MKATAKSSIFSCLWLTCTTLYFCQAEELILGKFQTRQHDLAGNVVALNDRVLEVRNMVYDGLGPAAFFWADTTSTPTSNGFRLLDGPPSSGCGQEALPGSQNETFRFEFPEGTTLQDIQGGSISVWCEDFAANFGEVVVPSNLNLTGLPVTGSADAPSLSCGAELGYELLLGTFQTRQHDLAGKVVALSDRVLEVRNMVYDGLGPAAFFWADTTSTPTSNGFRLLDGPPGLGCGQEALPGAQNETFRFEFPEGTTLQDIQGGSISVWCEDFAANFGEVIVPPDLNLTGLPVTGSADAPSLSCNAELGFELLLGTFQTRQHDLAGEVVALSDRVLEVRNMVYDGLGPAAFFWADTTSTPTSNGFRLLDGPPSSGCGQEALPGAQSETFRFEFPEGMTLQDIQGGSISVWCEEFSANFGEVIVPSNLNLTGLPVTGSADAPSLSCGTDNLSISSTPPLYNCESLNKNFQVRWKVLADSNEIQMELLGRIDNNVYMGFGVSGLDDQPRMLGADAVVADFFIGSPRARDFYFNEQAQCSVAQGACPDDEGSYTNDILAASVSGAQEGDLTLVRFRRPVSPTDVTAASRKYAVDRTISVAAGAMTTVIWAMGPVDPESGNPFFHSLGASEDLIKIEFGREHEDNCTPMVAGMEEENEGMRPFLRPVLTGINEFRANIGPSGGERGYASISGGRTAWGIAWYINDVLVPDIEMRRGETYKFMVNGGNDANSSSEYHPFYLTTSIAGGYLQLNASERAEETTFGGIRFLNETEQAGTEFEATAVAPICLFRETTNSAAATEGGFLEYVNSLDLSCASNISLKEQAAELVFTPDDETPDLIYYQCVSHTNLGWKIHVIDSDAPSILDVNCSNFRSSPLRLADSLTLYAVIDPISNTLTIELVYDGIGWLSLAFTDGTPTMPGAQAVIGLPNQANQQGINPAKYNLNSRDNEGVVRMPDAQQTLINATVTQTATQTIMKFTKLLWEEGEHFISPDRQSTFLFAHGSSNELGFHAQFGSVLLLPNQCAVRVAGILQNEYALNQQPDTAGGEEADLNRPLWVAHGACAAIAWAILVPLAIGASLIRKVLIKLGLPKSAWFQLHRGLNSLAALLTIAAFSLAVAATNKSIADGEEAEHFSATSHHKAGLAIFILTIAQAMNGILRPHAPAPAPKKESQVEVPSDEEPMMDGAQKKQSTAEANELETVNRTINNEVESGMKQSDKSSSERDVVPGDEQASSPESSTAARQAWQVFHRLLGLSLLLLTWWQVQDGLGLFALRFDEENMDTVFWIVIACIVGTIGIIAVYQRVGLKE